MSAPEPAVSGMAATPGVGATYKAREVEETLDVWFYRPLAGHLFLYRGWVPAACGIALLVTSEAFDSADGQLARLTGQYSKLGRILEPSARGLTRY